MNQWMGRDNERELFPYKEENAANPLPLPRLGLCVPFPPGIMTDILENQVLIEVVCYMKLLNLL